MKTQLLIAACTIAVMHNVLANQVMSSKLNYTHINMNEQLQKHSLSGQDDVQLTLLRYDILKNNKVYLVDFSQIKSAIEAKRIKQRFYKSSVISFDEDRMLISRYQGGLVYTAIDDNNLAIALKSLDELSLSDTNPSPYNTQNQIAVPMVADNIYVVRPIEAIYCTFPTVFGPRNNHPAELANLCNNNDSDRTIHLLYNVVLARSLPGAGADDAKIVHISLSSGGGRGSGTGISLNDAFKLLYLKHTSSNHWDFAGIWNSHVYSAIAQKYWFDISAEGEKAKLRGAEPSNRNNNYNDTEVHTITFGGSMKITGATAPQFGGEAIGQYIHNRWLSFNTQDYAIKRLQHRNNNVVFEWQREQYPTADSMLDTYISPSTNFIRNIN